RSWSPRPWTHGAILCMAPSHEGHRGSPRLFTWAAALPNAHYYPTITDDNRQQRIYRTWRGWVRTFYGTTALRAVSGAPGPRFADVRSGQEGGGCLQGHGSRSGERRFQAECARGVPAHDPRGEVRPRGDQLDRLASFGGRGARRQTGPARSPPDGAGAVAPRARRNRGPAPGQRTPAPEDAGRVPATPDG